ncbi:MAG: two-component system, NtrC family, response regulator HydG [Myxococcales bacterium]|nr:two-component system, NtrC family, response regulator HydG [Myxococcales bacterium]
MRRLRVLVVDDVIDMAETIANDLDVAGFDSIVADGGAEAIEIFQKETPDVVVTDLRMKSVDGLDVLDAVKRIDPEVPVIIMTAFGGVESAVEAMRRGAFYYVTKPFELQALRSLIERASRERSLTRENAFLRKTLRENLSARRILGQSLPMRQLRALLERVASAASPALILGETGTGKELVALAIHADGPRCDRPFVALNCAALPEQLLESELFGHARGAFTGASQVRRGLFLEADAGTLFLDEVGDLPLPLQGKLLRVLQSGEVRPVGSETSRTVDVRCIAATNKDLSVLVEKGQFREDLFFRLDVLRISVPSLRERSDDIAELAEHFIRKSLERSPRSVLVGFQPDALDYMIGYGWPGNVRQLENLIERLVVTASSPRAGLAEVRQVLGPSRETDPIPVLLQKPMTLQALEDRYIAAVLQRVGGSKQKAAEVLGVDPSTLYRRDKLRA